MSKGMTIFGANGEDYTINDPNIADEFSANGSYVTGDYCYYEGALWRFTANHSGAWNPNHTTQVTVDGELGSLKGQITTVADSVTQEASQRQFADDVLRAQIAPAFNAGTSYTAGQYVTYENTLYRFTANHSGAWNNDHVTQVTVGSELISQGSSIPAAVRTAMQLDLATSTRITAGSDMDDYTTPGNYHIAYFSDAGSIAHVPEQNPAKISVLYTGNDSGLMQAFYSASCNVYYRTHDGLGWHGWQRIGYGNGIIEATRNEFTNEKIVLFQNTQLVNGQLRNTGTDARTYLTMCAVTMNYDEVDAVFTDDTTTIGRNTITVIPTVSCNAVFLKHNGLTKDIGIKFYAELRANHQYMLSYDVLSADPTTVEGVRIENIQLEEAYGATKYIQGMSAVDAVARENILPGRWQGKTIVVFGDSRTWYDGQPYASTTKPAWAGNTCIGYQQKLAELTGATIISQGGNGETSAQICTRIRAYNFNSCDAVLLEGGVNDYIKSSQVTIGKLEPVGSAFSTGTVYGAWQSAVEYILTNYPRVKIFLDVPAIAWSATGSVFPYDVAKIKKDVAELYNLPCCDLYKEAGLNTLNRDYYYADDPTDGLYLHFNDYGNAMIGAILAGYLHAETGNPAGCASQEEQERNTTAVRGLNNRVQALLGSASYDLAFANAPAPLNLKNYTGNIQNVHPKVLYFPGKFGNHYYWMAYTPYPNGKDKWENPCIAYSDDGYTWTNIVANPLDAPTDSSYYNSDTHLVYRSDTGVLECWYRAVVTVTGGRTEKIYRQTSTDGITWGSKELVYETGAVAASRLLSPAVIWDGTNYNIWVVDNNVITYYTAPGTSVSTWTKVRTYSLTFTDSGTSVNAWHLDVIQDGSTYIMIVMTMNGSATGTARKYSLFLTTSQDNVSYGTPAKILGGSSGWDNLIYRATIVKVGSVYRVYYSAFTYEEVCGIGIMESTSTANFIGVYV